MLQYPLNELKRCLEDDETPLPKRFRLAKNVVHSHHFPTAPKQRVVAEWLETLTKSNKLTNKDLRDVLSWLNSNDDLTGELKCKLIKIVSKYLHTNLLQNDDIHHIVSFIENVKISPQLYSQIDDYLFLTTTLLQHLRNNESKDATSQKVFHNMIKYYKDSKKKLELIVKLLDGENLECLFSFLDSESRNSVMDLFRNILFPVTKKSFFASFFLNLIQKDNIAELIAERGDNIQSVLKIMNSIITFPRGRTDKDPQFLSNFIDVFVTCFRTEGQMIFGFYIMLANSLNMQQNYMASAINMPPIMFEENDQKIKRNLFLKMLTVLLENEIDINVKLTDTLGAKVTKVELKKNFMSFLQAVMMGLLKLEGKPDKTTLQIIKVALKLDPSMIEQKIEQIFPLIMTMKKNSFSVMDAYTETLNSLLEILFKLSRGIQFLSQIINPIKVNLETMNVEQFELKQKLAEYMKSGEDYEKIQNKIITGTDIFPEACVDVYGKLTSELMFRQNKDLLMSLQKDFEEQCLMMLEEGFVSPSIITLAEVMSAILSSFMRHSKMADHTVPQNIAEDFWTAFQNFEVESLTKFGTCVAVKLSYNPPLIQSFLELCLNVAHLKLLNMKYSNFKMEISIEECSDVFDFNFFLPYLSAKEWVDLASRIEDENILSTLDNLLIAKIVALDLSMQSKTDYKSDIRNYLITRSAKNPDILNTNHYFARVLLNNLDASQIKQLAKYLVKFCMNNDANILNNEAIANNKLIVQALALETAKNVTKCFENSSKLTTAMNKNNFEVATFLQSFDVKKYFQNVDLITEKQETVANCVELFKELKIGYLEENIQLTAIFVLLTLKKCCDLKKITRNIDYILQSIYELSPKHPAIYKLFPIDFIFSFKDRTIINLLTLNVKSSNNLLIKNMLELAVKKVKVDSELVNKIVEILLSKKCKNTSNMDAFSDPVFEINCIILPLIAKEKKAITTSAYRSILANLQEKLNKAMLDSFKNIDFGKIGNDSNGNIDDVSDNMAILNAMGAYSLTLLKCCETTDADGVTNLNCLWCGLEFFVQSAIKSIQDKSSKPQHVESSIQLLNVTLRYIKKLESHEVFQKRDQIFLQIWQSIKLRLYIMEDHAKSFKKRRVSMSCVEEIAVTLKFLAELSSVECFAGNFVGDVTSLSVLKKPSLILKNENITNSQLTTHKVSKYLWTHCLKANIIGPKCLALSKLLARHCKHIRFWIQQHYESHDSNSNDKMVEECIDEYMVFKIDDPINELLRLNLDIISECILAAKKISLDYKCLDSVFELQHLIHYILGLNTIRARCEISWQSFFRLFEGCMIMLNNLLLSREELLEDRWPCYMQCYKALVNCLCERSTNTMDRAVEDKLAEAAHSVEKLTQSICKRKNHVSRIAAYAVADICSLLERKAPPKILRQHLENSIAMLIQASDSTYAMAFLRRALAGSMGQMTVTNMYTMYKRYHKYVGNA